MRYPFGRAGEFETRIAIRQTLPAHINAVIFL
jgi:hypothetical protein